MHMQLLFLNKAAIIATGGLSGGLSSSITGCDFWRKKLKFLLLTFLSNASVKQLKFANNETSFRILNLIQRALASHQLTYFALIHPNQSF